VRLGTEGPGTLVLGIFWGEGILWAVIFVWLDWSGFEVPKFLGMERGFLEICLLGIVYMHHRTCLE
jgi:hypothetical protein